jgi:hypothetical protein
MDSEKYLETEPVGCRQKRRRNDPPQGDQIGNHTRRTERRPIPGVVYHGFIVHPRQPGPVTVAIAHKAGEKIVLDLCRDGLTIADAANLMKAYNITKVTGANNGATASRWRT